MDKINVITVDGPSASGKGSLARKIAQIFDLAILDSGSLYRLYAFFVEEGIDLGFIPEIIKTNIEFKITQDDLRIANLKDDITNKLRSEHIAVLASELKVKESDRLKATSDGFKAMNIKHEMLDDGLIIYGQNNDVTVSKEIDSFGDHRIAMSFLVAGMRSKDGIIVKNCKNIETSFPDFLKTMNALGMKIHG